MVCPVCIATVAAPYVGVAISGVLAAKLIQKPKPIPCKGCRLYNEGYCTRFDMKAEKAYKEVCKNEHFQN